MPWSYRQMQIEDRPVGVLADDRFRNTAPISELPKLAWFGVYCQKEPDGGFWHPEETSNLDAIEKDLIRMFGQFGHGWAVYLMRIDSRGIREYYFYCGTGSELEKALPHLQAAYPNYRIEFQEIADAEWKHYKSYLG